MKKLFLFFTIIFYTLSLSSGSYAELKLTGVNARTGSRDYIDPAKIKIDGSSRYYWVLTEFKIPNKNGIMSVKVYEHTECDLRQTRQLKYAAYELSMGEGSAKEIWTAEDQKWRYVLPNSMSEAIFNLVCSHKK